MNEIEKDKLIKKEIRVLKKLTKDIDEDKKIFSQRLIEQAAFMYATLQELQEIVNKEGAVHWYINGAQKTLREHPASKTYNIMIKNYSNIIKQLSDISPAPKNEVDPLMDYLTKKKR